MIIPFTSTGMRIRPSMRGLGTPFAILAAVTLISWLHFTTPKSAFLLHEVFKRLYYAPIVAAAMSYGVVGGL